MIEFKQGDMWVHQFDAYVNTVNCVGVMGKGIALEAKRRYPDMFEDYKLACEAGWAILSESNHLRGKLVGKQINPFPEVGLWPGRLHIWKTDSEWIINFPTKDHWRQDSKMEYIEAGLKSLQTYLSGKGPISVGCPALGCGNGNLKWEEVKPLIIQNLKDLECKITIFEPWK